MIKLNRKGYMTIEIILAAVITFVIAFFLIDITMKLSSNTDDAYSDTVLITDKTHIIKNIKDSLEEDICEHDGISSVSCNNKNCNIIMSDNNIVNLKIDGNKVIYSGTNSYSKNINNSLSNITVSRSTSNGYYNFKISGTNIFAEDNYDMNIFVYNECR